MAERSNELNEFGLVLGSLEPSEVTGSGFDGSVVMYASGSGAASQLFFKGADGAQKKLGFDIDALEAMTGTLDASDVFAIADVEADETDERKVTLGEYATHLASVTVGGLAVDGAKIKLDLNNLTDVGMTVADDHIAFIDANNNSTRKEKFADIIGNVAGAGLNGTAGVLSIDIAEYSEVTPANGDALLTLDSNGTSEQLTTLADLADLYAGAGMTATNSVMNVIGGDGITANANDVAVTAAQTTITSVKNDSLVVGRTSGNDHIDFGTDHNIILKTDNTARLTVTDGKSTFSNAVEMASNLEVKGNLYVSGSLTTIDTDNLRIEDNLVELNSGDGADTRASNANAGLYISGSVLGNDVTLKVASDGGRLKASGSSGGGFDIATGGDYAIAGTSVLNATTLGSAVVASSLTSVGTLTGGSIASGFGTISTANDITTTKKLIVDADATAIGANGALTVGAGQDASVYYDGANFVLDGASNVLMAAAGSTLATFDADGLSLVTGDSYQINSVNVLDHRTLGSAVTGSSLTAVGALAAGSIAEDFGAIDNGSSNITTGGKLVIDVDGTAINAAGALTMGQGNDAAIYFDGADLRLDTAAGADISFRAAGTELASLDENGLDLASGDAYLIGGSSVLNATTLGTAVVNSKLEGVNALTSGSIASGFGTISTANNITTSATLSGTTLQGGAATLGTAVVSNLTATDNFDMNPLVFGGGTGKNLQSDADLNWSTVDSFLQATGSIVCVAKNDTGASADGIAMFNSSQTRVAALNAGGLTIKSGGSHVLDFGDFAGTTAAKITSGTGASMLEMSSSAGLHFKGDGATGANNIITVDVGGNADLEAIVVNNNLGIKARFYRQSSDINLKKDIAKIPNSTSLEKVMSLKPVSYKFKSDNIADIGFIAQEVAEIAPEICGKHEVTGEGISIDYSKLTTLLAGAVQQQQVQINDLKEIIAKLQK